MRRIMQISPLDADFLADAPSVPSVFVYDTNLDALSRRAGLARAAAGAHEVVALSSVTALLLHVGAAGPGSAALVDLYDTDRFSVDRPGERIIARLARAEPRTRLVAWTAHISPDVIEGARASGADAVVIAGLDPDAEIAEIAAVIAGSPGALGAPWAADPAAAGTTPWAEWFERRYGIAWVPWMEPALVRLATTGERAALAEQLSDVGAATSRGRGVARLRDLSQALAGERYRNTALVAREANLVLALIAGERPLQERPQLAASLSHGVAALDREPSLVVAAQLSAIELEDLREQSRLIQATRAADDIGVGARPAGWADAERLHAAGRRAAQLGASVDDVDVVAAGILARTDDALLAIAEAQRDALHAPQARAAAALMAAHADGRSLRHVDGVTVEGGAIRWAGRLPLELARGPVGERAKLESLTIELDDLLRDAH